MPERKRDRIQVTEEMGLRSAPEQLEALKTADEATHCLVYLIEELNQFHQDESPFAKIQQASGTIMAMAYRSARACILVIAAGYVPESFPLKRRVSEAVLLVEHITADIYGTRATEWLEGRKPSLGKLTAKKPERAQILNRYSTGAHIDLRTLPRQAMVSRLGGERAKGFPLSGTREPELANHLLIELAIECRKLAYDFAWYVLDREIGGGSDTRTLFEKLEAELDSLVPRLYPATIPEDDAE
ncbi:MAG TPA: hypothetical protein VK781_10105 [Solirubrobacteraceae bacterium]|jgi:hypothetical protein|nr:hypothetical protein [Solirubrobacteraceae bacterium]